MKGMMRKSLIGSSLRRFCRVSVFNQEYHRQLSETLASSSGLLEESQKSKICFIVDTFLQMEPKEKEYFRHRLKLNLI